MSRYLDPKNDVTFKKVFGEHPHLLKSFLNALLPLPNNSHIESLTYLSAEQAPQIPTFKRTIVDVKCTDQQGRVFVVEMQMDWVSGFMQRMLFNASHAYIKQLYRGEDYRSLCPVYGLGLINSTFDESEAWYHHYQIINVEQPKKQLEGLEFVFVELPKFKPSTWNERKLAVLWLRFLSEIRDQSTTIPEDLLEVPEIREACALAEESAYTEAELEAYQQHWDMISRERTLTRGYEERGHAEGRAEGLAEGHTKGLAEGHTKGLAEGHTKGLLEGRIAERKAMAKKLLSRGLSPEEITMVTELSMTEISD